MQVPQEILNQLGGNKFLAMTGAKNLVSTGRGIQFSLPRAMTTNKASKCQIVLTNFDTYDMTFYNIRGVTVKEVGAVEGLYADQLQEVFTYHTGLDTKL